MEFLVVSVELLDVELLDKERTMTEITLKKHNEQYYMPNSKEDFIKIDKLQLFPFINKESVSYIEELKGIKFIINGENNE